MQSAKKLPTSMEDIQTRYQKIPYGWKEIDVAAVVALLIYQQKVTIKYGGATIRPDNPKLPDMLRKKDGTRQGNDLHEAVRFRTEDESCKGNPAGVL